MSTIVVVPAATSTLSSLRRDGSLVHRVTIWPWLMS